MYAHEMHMGSHTLRTPALLRPSLLRTGLYPPHQPGSSWYWHLHSTNSYLSHCLPALTSQSLLYISGVAWQRGTGAATSLAVFFFFFFKLNDIISTVSMAATHVSTPGQHHHQRPLDPWLTLAWTCLVSRTISLNIGSLTTCTPATHTSLLLLDRGGNCASELGVCSGLPQTDTAVLEPRAYSRPQLPPSVFVGDLGHD